MRTKRNPFGFSLTDLALIGGAAWLFLTPNGKQVLDTLFPPIPEVPGSSGVGSAIGELPGQPGTVVVPRNHQFRISNINFPTFIVRNQTITVDWIVQHMGPAGEFVVGLDLSPFTISCFLGQREPAFQTIFADLSVGDDGVFTTYAVSATGQYLGGAPADISIRGFVRDTRGNVLTEILGCGKIIAVI